MQDTIRMSTHESMPAEFEKKAASIRELSNKFATLMCSILLIDEEKMPELYKETKDALSSIRTQLRNTIDGVE